MPSSITASATHLMEQAPEAAAFYFRRAIEHIDNMYGRGYAKAHPELISSFMYVSAIDMASAVIAKELGNCKFVLDDDLGLGEVIGRSLELIADAISELKPDNSGE